MEIHPLHLSQYRQVAEWEFGRQPEGTDWERYEREMSAPQWRHLGLYRGNDYIGCVSLEFHSASHAEFHVVTARKKVKPWELAEALLRTARFLFDRGYALLTVSIPATNRAAARLAIRCGMKEEASPPYTRYFTLTKPRYRHGIH